MIFNLNFSRRKSKIDKNTNFEKLIIEVWTKRPFRRSVFLVSLGHQKFSKTCQECYHLHRKFFYSFINDISKNNYNITATMENCNSIFLSSGFYIFVLSCSCCFTIESKWNDFMLLGIILCHLVNYFPFGIILCLLQ